MRSHFFIREAQTGAVEAKLVNQPNRSTREAQMGAGEGKLVSWSSHTEIPPISGRDFCMIKQAIAVRADSR